MIMLTNGSERGRWDSNGRFLVGTSSARTFIGSAVNSQLQIEGTNDDTSIASITRNSNNTGAGRLIFGKSRGTANGAVTVVQSGDNLGSILFEGTDGTDTATAAAIDCVVDATPGANDMPGRLVFSTTADGASSPTERMRITNGGYIGFGTATFGQGQLATNIGTNYYNFGANTSNAFIVYNSSGTGVYLVSGNTAWTANSDERLKTNLQPITNAAQKISTLRAVTGRYVTDPEDTSRAFLIAQDVKAVLPEAVNIQQDENGTLGLQYTDVIPLLVAAVKEQQVMIAELQAEVVALKSV
jgi:hypothetical protein